MPAASCPPLADAATTRTALVVVLLPSQGPAARESAALGRALLSIPSVSVGVLSTAQGAYTSQRMLADIDQARRIATANRRTTVQVLYAANAPSTFSELRSLTARRPYNELIAIVQRARTGESHELVWSAVAGLDRGGRALTSPTTRQAGLVAAMDVAPTLLHYLHLPAPTTMPGHPVESTGALDAAALPALKARLEVIYPRRLPALACLLAAWALLVAAAWLPLPIATRVARARRALRIGALALLWTPVATLLPAALEPSAAGEFTLLTASAFGLGALTDVCLPWPRAPIAPAVAAVVALSVDALAGTQLLLRSLLGPNPAYGSRFYGIGNELKSALAVLVLAAVAAGLYRASRSRRAAAAMAGGGALVALVEGPARIGAGVGGVILVCAAAAVASAMLLPGRSQRRRTLAVLAAPAVGLLVLAGVDVVTAHGAGHFTGSVLHAHSLGDLQDLVVRRYRAAWDELGNGLMPLATALATLLLVAAVRSRELVLAPVASDPAWKAALVGGVVAGVVGALVEDSGPVLLLVAVFTLACELGYLWGSPSAVPLPRAVPTLYPATEEAIADASTA